MLGHANWRLTYKLCKLKLVKGLPELHYYSDALYEAWQKGKIVKTAFKPKNIVSTSRSLELLHIDLVGIASINGKKYGLVLVDDYSKWTWVKFLKTKEHWLYRHGFVSEVIMEENLKMSLLKTFVKNMEYSLNSLLLELHNKMGL